MRLVEEVGYSPHENVRSAHRLADVQAGLEVGSKLVTRRDRVHKAGRIAQDTVQTTSATHLNCPAWHHALASRPP